MTESNPPDRDVVHMVTRIDLDGGLSQKGQKYEPQVVVPVVQAATPQTPPPPSASSANDE